MREDRAPLSVTLSFCVGLFGIVFASACMAQIATHPSVGLSGAHGLIVKAGIGCRLVGGTLVCGRDGGGGGLLDRKVLPRKRVKEKPVEKKTYTPKKPSSGSGYKPKPKAKSGGSSGGGAAAPAAPEPASPEPEEGVEPEELEAETAEPETRACPPGHMVLAEPNEAGSYCEKVEAAPADDKPAAPEESKTQPTSETVEIPANIRAAACAPGGLEGACACPAGADPGSESCKAALPWCCSAQGLASGKPAAVFSACGADQNAAMSKVVTTALQKKLTMGPVRCTAE
jgi:hypothetical protein